jgi:transposase-like protein
MIGALSKVIKRMHYPLGVMLTCVRWYVAYPLSLRHLEEMMAERGVCVDHATAHRWAIKIVLVLAAVFRRRKRPVGKSWRMDDTYIKVHGRWKYLYRAVAREGDTIDKSGANTAAIESYNAEYCSDIELRQCKYLNNIVEQDHRAIKRIVRPMLGFKVFRCARILITGIETMHMIRKGQLDGHDGEVLSAADQFYSLAF